MQGNQHPCQSILGSWTRGEFALQRREPVGHNGAARIYAELLAALGRKREARDWLRQLLPQLPAAQPDARRAVVADRLAALERELASRP